jgi:hypothetical protein
MNPLKFIITSKTNLRKKYQKSFPAVVALLNKLKKADKARKIVTEIIFIDDVTSMKKFKVKQASSITPRECKRAVDRLFVKWSPAYVVIFGSQDIFPFQDLVNPADDEDSIVPSDLPYVCSAAFGTKVNSFTGPSRVLGRIPDVPGNANVSYVTTLIENIIAHKPSASKDYKKYFAVSAKVWAKSTELSLKNMFGNNSDQLNSPPSSGKYSRSALKPLTHFYNCHGAFDDPNFYGQEGKKYPTALSSKDLLRKITPKTVAAAECCYGAQMADPVGTGNNVLSISNQYLFQKAVAFMGSSSIAYGPADSQGLADLITQYFIKKVLEGASTGRAMLEAQQQFLINTGPDLDPYELKTLAQFFLLGDPSVQPVDPNLSKEMSGGNTIENRRKVLFKKGEDLKKTSNPSEKVSKGTGGPGGELKVLLKKAKINRKVAREHLYKVPAKKPTTGNKKLFHRPSKYRAFVKQTKSHGIPQFKVLVVKESDGTLLGWRLYVSR